MAQPLVSPNLSGFERLRRRLGRENRTYIIPSGRGLLFLVCVLVLVLTAATYNNNLIYILAFVLFALFFVSMLQTHYNIKGVRLEFLSAEETFEGEPLAVLFQIVQDRVRLKRSLEVRSLSREFKNIKNSKEDLDPFERRKVIQIVVEAPRRGFHGLPTVALETYFPLGLFRAWKIFRPQGELVVYPKPMGSVWLEPVNFDLGEEDLGLRASPEGDFGELKLYQTGESYHQIAWKQYARTGELYSKVHWGEDHRHFVIPWGHHVMTENRLRQMSAWIQQALDEDATFEMELPDGKVNPGAGVDQARLCWRSLAAVKAGT